MKRHLALVGLLLAATGCASTSSSGRTPVAASSGGSSALTATATTVGTDAFRFTPSHVTAKAGDVTLRLLASGSYPHNISLPQLHRTSGAVGTAPGSARSAVLHLHGLRPGVYRFVCTFHSKAGMTGELVVE